MTGTEGSSGSGPSSSGPSPSGSGDTGPGTTSSSGGASTSTAGQDSTAGESGSGSDSGSDSGSETSGGPELPEGGSADTRFAAAGELNVFDAAAHPDGGMLIVGNTLVGDNREAVIAHIGDDGTRLWSRLSAGLRNDQFFGVTTTDTQIYAAGLTRTLDGGFGANDQILISEFGLDGTYQRSVVFGNASREHAWGVTALDGGGLAVTGLTNASGIGDIDGFLMVLDADLEAVFAVGLGGAGADVLRTVHADGDGFIVGGSQGTGADAAVGLAARVGSDGTVEWSGTLDTTGFTELRAGVSTDDGRNVLVGFTAGFGLKSSAGIVAVFDGDVPSVWTVGETGADRFAGVVADGNRLSILGSTGSGSDTLDPWLVRATLGPKLEVDAQFVYPAPRDQLTRTISELRRSDGGLGFGLAVRGDQPAELGALFTDSLGGVDDACTSQVAAAFPLTAREVGLTTETVAVPLSFGRTEVSAAAFPMPTLKGSDAGLCED